MWTIFRWLLSLTLIILFLLGAVIVSSEVSPKFYKNVHNLLPTEASKVLSSIQSKVTWKEASLGDNIDGTNDGKSLESNYITFSNNVKEKVNCKVWESFKWESLDEFTIACGKKHARKVFTYKLLNIDLPEKGECGFEDTRSYLWNKLRKRYVTVQVFWKKDWYEYINLYHDKKNMNRDLLEKGLGVYIEHWAQNVDMLNSYKKAIQTNKGIFKKCNITNPLEKDGTHQFKFK